MRSRRRLALAFIVVASAPTSFLGPAPAASHGCVIPVEIPLNKISSVTIGADNDGAAPVNSVEVEIPDGFDLDRVLETPPWTSTTSGRKITFTGGEITIGTCTYFSLAGTATKKAVLRFPITTRAADGTERRFVGDLNDPLPAQLVYAGVKLPRTTDVEEDGSSGSGPMVLGVALTVAGLGGFGFMLYRDRRRPSPRARPRPTVSATSTKNKKRKRR